ncbi:McrB family protein [Clostridium perfringens]|uniref:McrB family protein n=1 Tax=Clostridium perfringens TaxID=1502 RepID=UPI000E127496|nr:AAA family ATPase [Clostridium perfringens]STB10801.1 AAA domain (dynein-related subfamily) [Clostridium novyi]SUY37877.1 AAA domain (dynein-related subfamily) [Clostridium perfringens]
MNSNKNIEFLNSNIEEAEVALEEKGYGISSEKINSIEENKRLEYLLKNFFESKILLGRIFNKHEYYMHIQLVVANNININYKLDNKNWMIYCKLKDYKNEFVDKEITDNLKKGDLIYFEPKLNIRKKEQIIEVRPETVNKLVYYKEFLENAKINIDDVHVEGYVGIENQEEIKIWASKEFYNSLNFLHESLINTLKEKNNELLSIEEKIENKIENKRLLEEQLKEIEEKIEIGKKAIEKQNKTLEFLGFEKVLDRNKDKITRKYEDYTTSEIIDYLRRYLFKHKKLKYTESILRRFLLAIKCNELIILSGPSGTGKTSLVNGFSEAVGGEVKIIPVKPSWTDTEDLIGFYNPIEKSYISTPFLDAIIEAKKKENKEKLYLICLDEMNIAHVEYYFAEFLSKLELDEEKKVVELYSEEIYKEILEEVISLVKLVSGENLSLSYDEIKDWCSENNKKYPDFVMDIRKKVKFIEKYPARFEIPENIRFIGTMNIDHTTKVISPKVIDRSFIIELTQQLENNYNFDQLLEDECEKISLDIDKFLLTDGKFSEDKVNNLVYLSNKYLNRLSGDFNYRSKKHITNYFKNGEGLSDLNPFELYSDMLYMKILPRLNCIFKTNDERFDAWKKLYEELMDNSLDDVKRKIEKMDKFADENKILSFWSVY